MTKSIPTTMALAAAALFLGACDKDKASSSPDDAANPAAAAAGGETAKATKIKCFGANDCTAQGACDVPDGRVESGSVGHACAGQNECKGKGWVSLPEDECATAGGEPL